MKKIFALVLCLAVMLSLVSCGKEEYKLGMGVVVSTASSKTGTAQVDATAAAVITDADGVIVACRIDVAQNKMAIADGEVDLDATFKTKMEKLDDYGMANKTDNDFDGQMLEWYEQVHIFEQYVVGMTADEVASIRTQYVNNHWIATDKALLNAGCSMQITEFIEAVVKACDDVQGVTFKATANKNMTLGLAATSFVDSATKSATFNENDEAVNGSVNMYTDFACAVVVKGKIVATLNDAIQPKITIDVDGGIVETEYKGTKREQRTGYNMAPAVNYGPKYDPNEDGKVLEWYLQSQAFSKHVVGMTADEVANMETAENTLGYQMTTDADLLAAGCTIQITDIKAVVAKAANNATSIK